MFPIHRGSSRALSFRRYVDDGCASNPITNGNSQRGVRNPSAGTPTSCHEGPPPPPPPRKGLFSSRSLARSKRSFALMFP
jgi:hypothetical protein